MVHYAVLLCRLSLFLQEAPLSDEILLTIFNQYNQTKSATSNIPNAIYSKNKDRLNDGWNKRVRN